MNPTLSACEDLLEGLDEEKRADLLKRFGKLDRSGQDALVSNTKLSGAIAALEPKARFQALRFLMHEGALEIFIPKGYRPDPLLGKIASYIETERNALPLPRLVRKLRFYLVKHGPLHMQGFVERFPLDHLMRAFTSRVLHTLILDENLAFNIPLSIDPQESEGAWREAFQGRIRKCWLLSYVDSPQRARPTTEGLNLSAQFNRFTDLNYRALYYLNVQNKTVGTCLNCLLALEDMLRCYLGLFHGANVSATLEELRGNFPEADIFWMARDQVEKSIRQEFDLREDSDLQLDKALPTHSESLMMAYDGEKANRLIHMELQGLSPAERSNVSIAELINILHQKGLAKGAGIFDGLRQAGGRVITEISLEEDVPEGSSGQSQARRTNDFITFIDLRRSRQGGSVPFPVRVIVDAVTRNANIIPDTSRLKTILYVSELESHLDVKIGGHSARIHYSLAPPERGGRFGLQYAEGSNEEGNLRRLEVMARAFRKGGLKVTVSGQLLEAVYDKDCGAATLDSVREKASLVLQILASMPDLDYALEGFNGSYAEPQHVDLFGYFDKQAMDQLLEAWAQHCFENGFFFLDLLRPAKKGEDQFYHRSELYWDGLGPYTDPYQQRMHYYRGLLESALRESLQRVTLPSLGLGAFPIGQSLFDRLIDNENRALRHSLLTLNDRGYARDNPVVRELRQHPVTLFLDYLKDDAMLPVISQIAQLAEQVSNLGSWEDLGKLGGLWVSRLRLSIIKDVLSFFVLRTPETRRILSAFATIGEDPIPVPFIDRVAERIRPSNIITNTDWISLVLNIFGYRVKADPECPILPWEDLLSHLEKPNPPDTDLGIISIPGVITSPGLVTGRFRANSPGRSPLEFRDGILVDHYLTPSDDARIQAARGVVITSGGELSHAAIRTREFRKPSIILKDISYQDGMMEYSPHYNQCSMTCYPLPLRHTTVHACYCMPGNQSIITAREGDVLRLDAEKGKLTLLGNQEGIQRGFESILAIERQPRVEATWTELGRELESLHDSDVFHFLLSELVLVQNLMPERLEPLLEAARSNPRYGREAEDYLRHIYLDVAMRTDSLLQQEKLKIIRSGSLMELCYYLGETVSRCERLQSLENLLRIKDAGSTLDRLSAISELVRERIEHQRPNILEELISALVRIRQQEDPESEFVMLCKKLLRRARDADLECEPAFLELSERIKDLQEKKAQKAKRLNACGDSECFLIPKSFLDSDFRSLVGGKASHSGEMLIVLRSLEKEGVRVPHGFATTTDLWRLFQENPPELDSRLADALCRSMVPNLRIQLKGFAELLSSRRLGSLVDEPAWKRFLTVLSGDAPEPSLVQEELEFFCSWLMGQETVRADAVVAAIAQVLGRFAVRSSGVREDSMEESYAGQKLTVLNVLGPRELTRAVVAVLSSGAEAVLIEEMVSAEVSGVAFSVHPGTGNFGHILVNSAYGLGEGIVSGRVDPDTLIIDKKTGRLLGQPLLGRKATRIVPAFGEDEKTTREDAVPEELRLQLSLKDRQQFLLCSVVRTLEDHFGYPLDVEWAVDPLGRLYILQSRPITTLWETLAKGKAFLALQKGVNRQC